MLYLIFARIETNCRRMLRRILLFFLAAFSLSSCVSRKQLTYLQDKGNPVQDTAGYYKVFRQPYRVQVNDMLDITVRSINPEANAIFNVVDESGGGAAVGEIPEMYFYLKGYIVDQGGFIDMPVLGKIRVIGLTSSEIQDLVNEKLGNFFTDNSVNARIQLAGIRFTVLGEVNSPGRYIIYQNQVNVFEALAQAGDATTMGKRSAVQLIRQYPEGVKVFELDLTDRSVINDPNYLLQPNDILNVQPLPARTWGIGTTGFQTFASILGVLASAVTLAFTISRF